ncbi:IS1/IS1595 family N-terminal zinc-binding domain-containing protein [Hymenobacter psychrotolerans]|uniref:Helix-turn-helix domain-containing protein n=1 Tax=Hymenobacter psychrotolerans DSM 18569 TaxID=1121959 RepID=A0A1M6SWJ3_9BACT|nr:helix-turn-helix domain-containing protein [Hymenobacter psychrotolerans]SHK49046.1 Helix-turn-helix domain-containing protein [Hymenobacter psychrotolerans DSM 18569]
MAQLSCPKCESKEATKSGIVGGRQRYKCKNCGYHYSVAKTGKETNPYYVIKALQLYVEGVSYREIERLLGVSHVSVMNWVKKYGVKAPRQTEYHPTYKILNQKELAEFFARPENLKGAGMMVTELGDKYMMIRWERFRQG